MFKTGCLCLSWAVDNMLFAVHSHGAPKSLCSTSRCNRYISLASCAKTMSGFRLPSVLWPEEFNFLSEFPFSLKLLLPFSDGFAFSNKAHCLLCQCKYWQSWTFSFLLWISCRLLPRCSTSHGLSAYRKTAQEPKDKELYKSRSVLLLEQITPSLLYNMRR